MSDRDEFMRVVRESLDDPFAVLRMQPDLRSRLTQLRDEMRQETFTRTDDDRLTIQRWADTLDQILAGEALKGR